jgi:NADH-quinone oxidoreductase subunit G
VTGIPTLALAALDTAFVVSLEVRASAVTDRADVVLPVAPVAEKGGAYCDWEGRWRLFEPALESRAMPDLRVLNALADAMDAELGLPTVIAARSELTELGAWEGPRAPAPTRQPVTLPDPDAGEAVLATWHLLLDAGRLQDGEPYLAGTAHRAHARVSPATAAEVGLSDGAMLEVSTETGFVRLPVVVTPMPDRVVWVPTNSPGAPTRSVLRAGSGAVVRITTVPPDGTAVEEVQA